MKNFYPIGMIGQIVSENDERIVREITIDNNGKKIRGYYSCPRNAENIPCCIISHGTNDSLNMEAYVSAGLAKEGIASVYFNFCGSSDKSLSDGSHEQMSLITEKEDLEAVLSYVETIPSIDTDNISLFGRSLGGVVSALAANDNPERVKNLFLLSPAFCIIRDLLSGNLKRGSVGGEKFFKDAMQVKLPNGFPGVINTENYDSFLGYNGNVSIYHGLDDRVAIPADSIFMNECYENSTVKWYEGENHSFGTENLDRVIKDTAKLIKENMEKSRSY